MSRLSVVSADKVNSTTEQLMKEFTQRIVANPPGVCPVDMQLAFLKVCHAQTCGKCVPCRIGLGQLEDLLEKVLDNEATMDTLKLIEQTAENIKNSADCAIGFESARMVLAGLEGFKEDYISHITEHRCLRAVRCIFKENRTDPSCDHDRQGRRDQADWSGKDHWSGKKRI